MSTELSGFGITFTLPDSWEGRIRRGGVEPSSETMPGTESSSGSRRMAAPAGAPSPSPADSTDVGSPDAPGSQTSPIVHVANFALPADRGDYGSGAVDVMGPRNVFMVLTEFGPDSVGTALFAPVGLPRRLAPNSFSPNALQRRLPNQLGWQHFFTQAGRAFGLFVVLGGARNAKALCAQGTAVLSRTRIEPT